MKCRLCDTLNINKVIDLNNKVHFSVMSDNRTIDESLVVYLCDNCFLMQKESSEEKQLKYFSQFNSHQLTDGEEQMKFLDGKSVPRSELIVDIISDYILSDSGKILDIGTGNGAFLKKFQKKFPTWEMYGQDLQDNSKDSILQIISEDRFIHDEIKNIDEKFNIISVIHVLNHIVDLELFIEDIQKLLSDDGQLIIQVPYILKSISDLVIIESINHFSKYSIDKLLSKYFKNIFISNEVQGEMTIIASNKFFYKENSFQENVTDVYDIENKFNLLVSYLINNKETINIFGTSPLGVYCSKVQEDKIAYFIDEDESKIGKSILNKMVVHPKDTLDDIKIILPFFDEEIVKKIKKKYKHKKFIDIFES
ncbi:class I SAM-dependent methyltransferase [Sulfurimonas sp.]